jgi:hypothetical protein
MIVALIVTGTTVGILGNRFMPLREPWIEAIRRGRAVKTRRLTLLRPRRLAALSFSHPQAITTSMFSQRIRIRPWDASLGVSWQADVDDGGCPFETAYVVHP